MSGAAERLRRLLALAPWLLAHPDTQVAEVARTFGVTERALADDLNLLFVCGLPGHGPGDLIEVNYTGDRVSLSNADTIARPLRLSGEEALALIVGLRTLVEAGGSDDAMDAARRALAKIERAAGDAAEPSAHVAVSVESEESVRAAVDRALGTGRRLHLRYHVPGRDEATERDVEPMRVVVAGGRHYLEAFCRRADDVRLFRFDRVLDVRVLDEPIRLPPDAQPRDISEGLFRPPAEAELVTLELAPAARWVADYYPCESVDELPDGGLRVALRATDQGWARRLVMGLGPAARVVGPAALTAEIAAEARAALAGYDGDAPVGGDASAGR